MKILSIHWRTMRTSSFIKAPDSRNINFALFYHNFQSAIDIRSSKSTPRKKLPWQLTTNNEFINLWRWVELLYFSSFIPLNSTLYDFRFAFELLFSFSTRGCCSCYSLTAKQMVIVEFEFASFWNNIFFLIFNTFIVSGESSIELYFFS